MADVYGTNNSDWLDSLDGATNSADEIFGYGGHDTIFGLGGHDFLYGGDGNDTIYGNSGADMMKGGGGADIMDGGGGLDTASYSDSPTGVTVSLVSGSGFGGTAQGDTLIDIERITGSAHVDMLTGDAWNNTLNGLEGDDTLKGGGGADTLIGGSGIDTAAYSDSPGAVYVNLQHNVFLFNDAEGDELSSIENLVGSAFGDFLGGTYGANVIYGLNGNDSIYAYLGNDDVWGGDGNDYINGGPGDDTLRGENGNDTIDGFTGADTMVGGAGDDIYVVDFAGDEITEFGGEGMDTVRISQSWTLTPGADVEILETTNDAGWLNINLTGNASGNIVRGNNGNNAISGGDGNDQMTGLGGNDVFVFDTALSAAFNVDVITDFNPAGEYIYLDNGIFSNLAAEPDHFILSTEFHTGAAAGDADDHIIYDDSTGAIYYDSDGTGAAAQVQFARVDPGLSLGHDNFHVF